MTQTITKQILALGKMTREELLEKYTELFGREPPPCNRSTLLRKLTYRIQEIHFGGLSEGESNVLGKLAESDPMAHTTRVMPTPEPNAPGTRYYRLWHGIEHEVVATSDGKFEYQNRLFNSLSAVAREITGTRWNGRVFFGVERTSNGKA